MKQYVILTLWLIVCLACQVTLGQTGGVWYNAAEDTSKVPNNLLYAVDLKADPSQPQYFLPTIENILKNLRFADIKRTKRFEKVESANRFNEDADIYDYIKLIFEDNVQRSVTLRPSSSREKLAKRIQAYVREYDELLYVKINAGQLGFIEFQFYRYEIQEVDTTFRIDSLFDTRSNELIATDTIIDLPVHTYKRSSSIFINLHRGVIL